MAETVSSAALLEEFRQKEKAKQEELAKKVPLSLKLQAIRDYTDLYWIEQELEAKLEAVKREMQIKEENLEDLKAVRGNLDKIRRTKYWTVELESGKKALPGKNSKDAEEKYKEAQKQKAKFQEEQKEKNPKKAKRVKQ